MATIWTYVIARRDWSLTVLKWTLRATAVLAIAAALAAPVAVPAAEAAAAPHTVAVVAEAGAPAAPGTGGVLLLST
ncbi:hypothetical protein ABZV77_42545 [Streptomyces sp. NPDC004732]|uniref:hypothetical protein n=1 Tax=Streptomyces sp. NPDC004732 TaxID=3154290 RepID=UPI0033AEAF75